MATTSPDGIVSPDSDQPVDWVGDWAATASSVQTALSNRATKTGTSSERTAATGVREGTLWYDTSTTSLWAYFSASWIEISARAPLIQNLTALPGWTAVGNPRIVVYDRVAHFRGGFTNAGADPFSDVALIPSWAAPFLGTVEFMTPRNSGRMTVFSTVIQLSGNLVERSSYSWYVG